jgi:hypothetical protein
VLRSSHLLSCFSASSSSSSSSKVMTAYIHCRAYFGCKLMVTFGSSSRKQRHSYFCTASAVVRCSAGSSPSGSSSSTQSKAHDNH